ncbi:MAG: dsbD2 [Solimicrobium sp.]|jgi:thiol:disulfide interchange protein DsbD|nr:dsbD2 [Solimicrobium sp.]
MLGYFLLIFCLVTGYNNASAEAEFLQPEQAFHFDSRQLSPDKVEVTFVIADGYYMYRDRLRFEAIDAVLGAATIPRGQIKFDETFQKNVETLHGSITLEIPLTSLDKSKSTFTLIAHSQGCSDQGLCYVPMESKRIFSSSQFAVNRNGSATSTEESPNGLNNSLHSRNLLSIVPLFLLLGLGLAFTPCVLPMVPILSSIIVGEGAHVGKRRGLALSLSYSLGMAAVYTALGISAGLLGEGLAAALQNPLVLSMFGILLVGLSLSMFNVYHFQIPSALQSKLVHFSGRQRTGKLVGVFVMGAISALIVGPCVAAPLASALLYISQTRDIFIGGFALFSLAIGMSVPLILVGLSTGSLLPRVGPWMESIKQLFGVLMLAMALWIVSPLLPRWALMSALGGLLIGYSYFLSRHPSIFSKAFALMLLVLGLFELVGVTRGSKDVFSPLDHLSTSVRKESVKFLRIRSIPELDNALRQAKSQHKSVMLDFYADWCVACVEMERLTFTDDRVQIKLAQMVLLQVDVTENNNDDRALLKRFSLYGPPGMIFFGLDSQETGRVIGFEPADKFVSSLSSFAKVPS